MYNFVNFLLIFITLISIGSFLLIIKNYNITKKIKTKLDLSGLEVSRELLDNNELDKLYILKLNDNFNSHYDINRKLIRLSENIFDNSNLNSIVISAFYSSLAILDNKTNLLINFKAFFEKTIKYSLKIAYLLLFLGVCFNDINIIFISLIILCVYIIFYLICLKVDIDASKLTITNLKKYKYITKENYDSVENLLNVYILFNFAFLVFYPYIFISEIFRKK